MMTIEIIILVLIFASAFLFVVYTLFAPFLSNNKKKDCGQCPFADGCGKRQD